MDDSGKNHIVNSLISNLVLADGKLEITYRQSSGNLHYYPHCKKLSSTEAVPDTVWKDIYYAKDGVVVFHQRIHGKLTPGKTIPQHIKGFDIEETNEI